MLLDTISTGLSAPTSSGLGIAAATLSPAASYEIGQYFKSNDTEGSTAHILAHTLLGAAVAAAGGNDALTAGLAAGGAEASAPLLSSYLYGKETKDLTADEKSTISSIVGLAGSALGATTEDVASTVQSGGVAQNAVENNTLYQEYAILASKGKTREQEAEELVTGADEFYRKNNCAGLSATACNTKMYAERKEVLWLATGFLPVIGDIQTLAQAKSAGDVLWAMAGIVPGLGEARQAYKVAEKAGDLAGMKKALEQGTAIATQKGYVNKTKVTVNQTALKVTSKTDQDLVTRIAKGEDKGGELTEQLFNSLAKQNGFTVIKGGKYGSNNGFDHVWVAKDGSVTILSDSKQITNGTVKLAPNAAGGNTQLSKAWIDAVIDNLAPNDPTRQILINADKAGKLKTAVTGVDRATGQAVIIPVNVPTKSKPTVKK